MPKSKASIGQSQKGQSQKKPCVIIFGDSNSEGVGCRDPINRYSYVLARLMAGVELNLGVSGSPFQSNPVFYASGFNRRQLVIDALTYNAQFFSDIYLVILYGTNDTWLATANLGFNSRTFENQLSQFLTEVLATGIPQHRVLLSTPPWINSAHDTNLQNILQEFCNVVLNVSKSNGVRYFDLCNWLQSNGGARLFADGLHLNDDGHYAVGHAFYQALVKPEPIVNDM